MNQCFRGSFAENDLQSICLYSPTHSFHIEWLLNSVPPNITFSRRYTHTHSELAHHTQIYYKPAWRCSSSLSAKCLDNAVPSHVEKQRDIMHVGTELFLACTHTKTCAYTHKQFDIASRRQRACVCVYLNIHTHDRCVYDKVCVWNPIPIYTCTDMDAAYAWGKITSFFIWVWYLNTTSISIDIDIDIYMKVGKEHCSKRTNVFEVCLRGKWPATTGLYSPTHSFHIEWLLNSVPTNKTLSHIHNHNHDEFAHHTYMCCK